MRRKVRYEKIIQFSNFIATDSQIIFNRKGAKEAQSSLRKDYSNFIATDSQIIFNRKGAKEAQSSL